MSKLFDEITKKVTDKMETDQKLIWQQPYARACNLNTGTEYRGYNQLLLMNEASPYWFTWNNLQEEKVKLKKGAKASTICYSKTVTVRMKPEDTEKFKQDYPNEVIPNTKSFPMFKTYNVFNFADIEEADQEKLKEKYSVGIEDIQVDESCIAETINKYMNKYNITLKRSSDTPYFSPNRNEINMSSPEGFVTKSAYWKTFFHELIHSTGHESRLNRLAKNFKFGDHNYSQEELVAELGSLFLLTHFKMENPESTFNNSMAYIQSWLKALKGNEVSLQKANIEAQKAVSMITGDDYDKY